MLITGFSEYFGSCSTIEMRDPRIRRIAAVLAADILVSPITPEILSAREFKDGTMELLDRLEPGSALGATLGPMKAVIYRQDRTADARTDGGSFMHHGGAGVFSLIILFFWTN